MAGVRWLGNTLPEAELEVRQPKEQDDSEIASAEDEAIPNHPMIKLFKRPNPYMSASTMWKAFAYSWIISGNVELIKFRNVSGQVVQLWYEPHFSIRPRWVGDKNGDYIPRSRSRSLQSVEIDDDPKNFINYYEVKRDNETHRLAVNDVIHFRDGIDPYNTRCGLSAVATILREIFGDSAAGDYAGGVLANKGIPPGVLSINSTVGMLREDDVKEIASALERQLRTGRPLVVANAKYERTGLTPEEIDARVSRYMSEERFSAVTGIPLEVLNLGAGNLHSTYNNVSEAEKTATRRYLVPLWWHIDEELTAQLLRDFDQDEDHFVEHCLDEVAALQEDQTTEWARIGKAYQDGWLMRSEARSMANLPADEDGGDDVYYIRTGSQTMTLEQEEEERNKPDEPPVGLNGQQPLALAGQQNRKLLQGAPPRIKALFSAK